MANIILPVAYWLLTVGTPINLRNYNDYPFSSICNTSDIRMIPTNRLNSTYYVLQDDHFPTLGVPIDMAINHKERRSPDWLDYTHVWLGDIDYDAATLLITVNYETTVSGILKIAAPRPIGQTRQRLPRDATHYVDNTGYGAKFLIRITIRSDVTGDTQILRRILTDVMGKSGIVGKDLYDLYKKALKTMRESEDVRGKIEVIHNFVKSYVYMPYDITQDLDSLLKNLSEIPKYVRVPNVNDSYVTPLWTSFKPLHDIDTDYPLVMKNVVTERYLTKLYKMVNDLDYTSSYVNFTLYRLRGGYEQMLQKFRTLQNKVEAVRKDARKHFTEDLSIFKDFNIRAFESTFETYQKGLDNSTETYLTAFRRLWEEIAFECENRFLSPTRGSLIVERNEIKEKVRTSSLTECQDLCVKDARCRAVEYTDDNQCAVYYRSTRTAGIRYPQTTPPFAKIYDRVCRTL